MLPTLSPSWSLNEVVLHDIDTTQWKWDPSARFIDATDFDIVNTLWQRIRLVCSDTELSQSTFHSDEEGVAIGLNERMRILRYDPGAYFAPHYDGSYVRTTDKFGHSQRSLLTAQFYLNEGYVGGSTRFLNERNESQFYEVIPKVGSVLIFEHDFFHEGAELFSGRKYSLRTDVMYSFSRTPLL